MNTQHQQPIPSTPNAGLIATAILRAEKRLSPATQFKAGNTAWKARKAHGRRLRFASAQVLEDACNGYFQWVEDNPLMQAEAIKYRGTANIVHLPQIRPFSVEGLCAHLKITRQTWLNYSKRSDYFEVCERVAKIIWVQQLDGVIIGIFKPQIIMGRVGR